MTTKEISDVVQEEISTENWVEKEFSSPNKKIRLATSFSGMFHTSYRLKKLD